MPYFVGDITDTSGASDWAHRNFVSTLVALLTGEGFMLTRTKPPTATDDLYDFKGTTSTVSETWTLTCTGATPGAYAFSVVGSVSGPQATLTSDVVYNNSFFQVRINSASSTFTLGDQYTFTLSAPKPTGGHVWTVLRRNLSGSRETILKGAGYSGTEEIYIGFKCYESVPSDYYNITVAAFSGYVESNTFETQPAYMGMSVPAHNQFIPSWIVWNAQRAMFTLKVNVPAYETAYVGKFFPYALPSQYPYPIASAGMMSAGSATRYSDTTLSMPYNGAKTTLKIKGPAGVWIQPDCYPWGQVNLTSTDFIKDTNGYYPLMPIVLHDSANIYGEFDGVYYVSGFNNVGENTAVIDGVTYVFFLNVNRTGWTDYFAMRLE